MSHGLYLLSVPQTDLAEELDISKTTISRYINADTITGKTMRNIHFVATAVPTQLGREGPLFYGGTHDTD